MYLLVGCLIMASIFESEGDTNRRERGQSCWFDRQRRNYAKEALAIVLNNYVHSTLNRFQTQDGNHVHTPGYELGNLMWEVTNTPPGGTSVDDAPSGTLS